MRIWTTILLTILLTGCSTSDKDGVIKDIENSYINTIEFSNDMTELYLNLFDKAMVSDPMKVKPYYDKARTIHKVAKTFYDLADNIIKDSTAAEHTIDDLSKSYKTTLNTFREHLPRWWDKEKEFKGLDYSYRGHFATYPRLTALMLKNEMAINETNMLLSLLSDISSGGSFVDIIEVKTIPNSQANQNVYSFNLSSFPLQKVDDRIISLDTIIHNGTLKTFNTTVTPTPTFVNIRLDSLQTGYYDLKGTVKVITEYGKSYKFPFRHEFEIKKE